MDIEVIATDEESSETINLQFPYETDFKNILKILQKAFNKQDLTYFEYIDEEEESVTVECDNGLQSVFSYYSNNVKEAEDSGDVVKPLRVNIKSDVLTTHKYEYPNLIISPGTNSLNDILSGGKFISTKDETTPITYSDPSSLSPKSEEAALDSQWSTTPTSPIITDDKVYLTGEIGAGGSGKVMRALYKPTQEMIAVKIIDLEIDKEEIIKHQILSELAVLRNSKSQYIIDYYGAYFVEASIHICTELMDGFSLDRYGIIKEEILGKLLVPVIKGLDYLWSNNIIHRDVKPSNMLINMSGRVKLCDFGISKQLIKSIGKTFTGTVAFMSPERLRGEQYDLLSDIWSLGVSAGILATGKHPVLSTNITCSIVPPTTLMSAIDQFSRYQPTQLISQLSKSSITSSSTSTSSSSSLSSSSTSITGSLIDFINRCLQKDQYMRLDHQTIKSHSFYLDHIGDYQLLLSQWVSDHTK